LLCTCHTRSPQQKIYVRNLNYYINHDTKKIK
jgi:hypothetical protein